jgi:hypothetical protein
MDIRNNFLGPKIDIYEGPMLLQNQQVQARLRSNGEAYRMFEQVLRRQKVSTATNVVNSALGIGILFLAVGHESQSSSRNEVLLPLAFTGVGINVFSSFFERRTRNLTREALNRYNH